MRILTVPALITSLIVGSFNPTTYAQPEIPSTPLELVASEQKTVTRWVLPGASRAEAIVLNALQDRGITDRNALATILGNIKQESRFHPNICEGGARVHYNRCYRGGYGLIQWTTVGRYNGLGRHASRVGMDPSTLHAQVSFIFQEVEWKSVEHHFRRTGHSIEYYMNKAYYWLGWGIHGSRSHYAYQYVNRLTQTQVPVNV